jgi:hypothetical protein
MHSRLLNFVPGILLCVVLAVIAALLETIEVRLFHELYLEARSPTCLHAPRMRELSQKLRLSNLISSRFRRRCEGGGRGRFTRRGGRDGLPNRLGPNEPCSDLRDRNSLVGADD